MKVADIDHKLRAQARAHRDRMLRRTQEIYAACTCAWPLQAWRNGHGHAEDCPAVEVFERQDAERS